MRLIFSAAWRGGRGQARAPERRAARREHGAVYPDLDLRVDDHPDPVVELRGVYEVGKVELLPFVDALPTRDNPKAASGVEIRGTLIPADRALSGRKRARLHAVDPEAEPSLEGEQTAQADGQLAPLPQTGHQERDTRGLGFVSPDQ